MTLESNGRIAIPGAKSAFDHGAFDPKTRRVFVAHTGNDSVDVIDHDGRKHVASLAGFPEAAGVVADEGIVLVTNRGAASLAVVDAETLKTEQVFKVGPKPNGVAIVAARRLAIAACIGDATQGPTLEVVGLDGGQRHALALPGRPRWCVTDAAGERVFLAIQNPSMVLAARLPDLRDVQHWSLPAGGAHGVDIDHGRGRLYVACDEAALVEVDSGSGQVTSRWPIEGAPDVTFVNPTTGLVHVAIGQPGLVQSIDPRTGSTARLDTAPGAHTTALVPPDRLYVFSPSDGAVLVLADV